MKRTKRTALFLAIVLLLSLLGNTAFAANTAQTKTVVGGSYKILYSPAESTPGGIATLTRKDGVQFRAQCYEKDGVGTFNVQVFPGRYDITIRRDGYLPATIANVIADNAKITLAQVTLTAGDLNGDGVIDANDIMISERREFDSLTSLLDLDGNGKADKTDTKIVMKNLSKTSLTADYTNVTSLLCDWRENPMGLDEKNPHLSWKMDSTVRGQKQTGARIVVSSSLDNLKNGNFDVWDYTLSDENASDLSVEYAGQDLAARTRYYWTVFVSDKDGAIVAPSSYAYFETGLFGDFGDENKWITNAASSVTLDNTVGTLKTTMTLKSNAVGLHFAHSTDGNKVLLWQVNVTSGKVMFRPHKNTGLVAEVDLSDIYPSVDDFKNTPFHMTLKIDCASGTVETYFEDTLVHTYTDNGAGFLPRVGTPTVRVAAGESGTLDSWSFYDGNGSLVYENVEISPYAAHLFRKSFSTKSGKTVAKARLYATAAGTHETYLNGKRCSDDYLAPGKSEYNQILYYQTYDVTDLIESGENTLACQLGMGWYNGGPIGSDYGTNIGFKAKLILTYTDGTEQVIDTDKTWFSTANGPTTVNRFYIGQYIDGRKEIVGWNENGLDTQTWSNCKESDTIGKIKNNLVGENTNPIRVIREVHPVSVTNPKENVYVYKFPANMSTTLRITAKAARDTVIDLRYGEMLTSDGRAETKWFVVRSEIGDQNGEDKYTFAGKDEGETFEFSQVYHGFQYVEIEGLSEAIPLSDITALVLSTDNIRTGYFESSNMLLTGYFNNVIRSQESNFVGAITDCPTREKNNWTGDAQGFAYAANYNFNSYNIYRSFQEMTRHVQGTNGAVPEVVPHTTQYSGTGTPSGWSDTVILIPWQMYYQYGDRSFITESYDNMKAWADYLINECKDNDYVRTNGRYGDNVSYDSYMTEYSGIKETALSEIGTAYSAYSIGLLSKMAGIVGNTEDEAYYKAESEKFAAAWRSIALEEDGYTCKTTDQTAYAMGIYYNLYESEEKRQLAAEALADLIANPKRSNIPANAQTVGFIGYPILYSVLSRNGQLDTAFTILEREQYPGILYPVTQGATTTWEYYSKVNSLNHFFSGCVSAWLYTDILGISHEYADENVGYRHFVLRPTYGGSLTWARGSYDSVSGTIKSNWKLSADGTFTYTCTVPANTTATVMLPAESDSIITEGGKTIASDNADIAYVGYTDGRACYEVTSGVYEFCVKPAANA